MAYTKITNFTTKDSTNDIIKGSEIDDEFDAISTAIALNDAHIVDTSAAHAASAISYTGGTGMSATDVESAIDELANEKANLAGGTFTGAVAVPDDAYAVGWNGSANVPTKNAIYDKIESILDGQAFTGAITVPDDAYAVGWNGSTEVPTKNAVYDKIESIPTTSITILTPKATTSGTTVDFTGLPSGIKRISLVFNAVSTGASSSYLIQLGDSGGFETSGYVGSCSSGASAVADSTGFIVNNNSISASTISGIITLINISGNTWIESGATAVGGASATSISGGHYTLSGTLDSIRFTTVGGDTYDGGSVTVVYE
jgi:hypothetical protein